MVVKATIVSDGRGRLPSEYVFVEAEPAEVEALFDDPYPPETASATVRALLERAAASGLPITGSHLEARFRVERAGDAFDVARV